MTSLEDRLIVDRLRADLPRLAGAWITHAASRPPAPTAALTSLDIVPSADRPPRRLRVLIGAAALVAVVVAAVSLTDRGSSTGVRVGDKAASAPDAARPPADFGTWDVLPKAPIEPRAYPVAFWTGTEAVFWAGSSLDRSFAHTDGAAYNPTTDTWRDLVVPGWGHPGLAGAGLDGRLYVAAKGGAARYDPGEQSWTDLAGVEGMFFRALVATDRELWGIGPAATNADGQPDLAVARHDVGDDRWVAGPSWPGPPRTVSLIDGLLRLDQPALWTGSEI
ncbi:MAG: hypothetical protein ACE5GB_15435 [Acidimicrobiales bacterium]